MSDLFVRVEAPADVLNELEDIAGEYGTRPVPDGRESAGFENHGSEHGAMVIRFSEELGATAAKLFTRAVLDELLSTKTELGETTVEIQ